MSNQGIRIFRIEYSFKECSIQYLKFYYKNDKGDILEGQEMGKLPSSKKARTFNFLENDKITSIFSGSVDDTILYFKILSLQESRVTCFGNETWNNDAENLEFEISPSEYLTFAKSCFKSKIPF
jgi:hypothetical protein